MQSKRRIKRAMNLLLQKIDCINMQWRCVYWKSANCLSICQRDFFKNILRFHGVRSVECATCMPTIIIEPIHTNYG